MFHNRHSFLFYHVFHSVKTTILLVTFTTMLSELIKKKIEEKSEMKIRYSRDCEVLSEKIHEHCNTRLSPSTLRRLFGIVKGTGTVRAHTLDVISNFIGYSTWDELIESFDDTKKKDKPLIELNLSQIKKGAKVAYAHSKNAEVIISSMGKGLFNVESAINSQLKVGDKFKAEVLKLHHPFFVSDVVTKNKTIEKLVEGRVSGISSIKKV